MVMPLPAPGPTSTFSAAERRRSPVRPEDLAQVVEKSGGCSYAQLREGNSPSNAATISRRPDLLQGVRAPRKTTTQVTKPKQQGGFRLRHEDDD